MTELVSPINMISLIAAMVILGLGLRRLLRLLHILQLEEYETERYFDWLRQSQSRFFSSEAYLGFGVVLLAIIWLLTFAGAGASSFGLPPGILGIIGGGYLLSRRGVEEAKKPLVLTTKALILIGVSLGLAVLIGLLLGFLYGGIESPDIFGVAFLLGIAVSLLLLPLILALGNLLLAPVQGAAKARVINEAKSKVRSSRVRVVGITGSYGKTSTKEILSTILESRFSVLKPPASYNTPLGLSRVVNRGLTSGTDVLIAEMGAYYRGDIKTLCEIAPPSIGILTAVSPQHLERFKTLDNIATAKYELIEAVIAGHGPNGVAIFNVDNDFCERLADLTETESMTKVVRYGLKPRPDLDVTARDIRVTRRGLDFTLVQCGELDHDGETTAQTTVRLLGRHNVGNVLAATSAALALGMSLEEIARAAESIQPVEHRLQLIEGVGGVTVIDDAYNANPDGARAALEVLREYTDGKKVLVTPGMVELGDRERDENFRFGQDAAAICDRVILVGEKRTYPIREGLLAGGFSEGQIITVRSISDVQGLLGGLVGSGDVVLFENDLPDNYNE